jgi:hypothetical protein
MFASVQDYIERAERLGHVVNDTMVEVITRRIERESEPCECASCVGSSFDC